MSDPIFVDGLRVYGPKDTQPEWLKGSLKITKAELETWLTTAPVDGNGEIRIDIKESKKGSWYCQVNEWRPDANYSGKPAAPASPEEALEDIPF